ncbi:hypothetical protein WMY93_004824 [Mugilogobius chulae]|uniref:C-type lectin domain-containing protein n=1 Tax=Mugilogobius chulae TaxID=88201 RepID=A0AAW0Q0V4_9GOBI
MAAAQGTLVFSGCTLVKNPSSSFLSTTFRKWLNLKKATGLDSSSDTTKDTGAGFWDKGQPDDWDYMENGEDCGQLHSSNRRKRKLWNDADCSLKFRYICESNI